MLWFALSRSCVMSSARAQSAEKSKKKADTYGNTRSNAIGTSVSEATSTTMEELYKRNNTRREEY